MDLKKITFFGSLMVALIGVQPTTAQQTDTLKKSVSDIGSRISPPAQATGTLPNGAKITITYSQPYLKSRNIGKDIAPFNKIWRTGANEATTFEVNKPVTLDGKPLPAGKYSLYTIPGESDWIVIFNKVWNQWGLKYDEKADQLRIKVKPLTVPESTEMLTFKVESNGEVSLNWGKTKVPILVR